MVFRHALSRRDAVLILLGASIMHVWSLLSRQEVPGQSIVIDTQYHTHNNMSPLDQPRPLDNLGHVEEHYAQVVPSTVTATTVLTEITTTTATITSQPSNTPRVASQQLDKQRDLLHTSIISHAPGWTLFRNLYMSNGTLYILSSNRSFPEFRMMTSTGLAALNTPENIASREPTSQNMDFITPEEARARWGSAESGDETRVWSVEGNTLLFNDPSQFLRHYYHFVAELFFGTWSFWHGAWSTPSTSPAASYSLSHPAPPPIHRAIFAHSNADGWRDDPGFNAYFLRAAFPSLTVEVQEDWADRIVATSDLKRAWHFPVVLLTDRSAAHRGVVCGSQTQRTAAEAWEYMKQHNQLLGYMSGGWWEPIRAAVWRFAGVNNTVRVPHTDAQGNAEDAELARQNALNLPMPEKIVITYISRQGVPRRKLIQEDHDHLVEALQELVTRKGDNWQLDILQAEKMTKDEQVQAAARTTILLGVHGNGLTHLVFMKPNRVSAVIEMFYPGGFAHDYHWTSRALGMSHYAVWNDKYHTYPDELDVSYPKGFQGNSIPVHGPTVAKLIESHIESRR